MAEPAEQQQSVQRNIEGIMRLEEQSLEKRTIGERIADMFRRSISAM